jgi:alkylated DNA repair protein (DNA oxidative demethylase)
MMRSSQGLFSDNPLSDEPLQLADGALLLRSFASADAPALVQAVNEISAAAPFRNLVTPGGHRMSVAMTNCGEAGWVSDRSGYRYDPRDPETGKAWPPMPAVFLELARRATAAAGFAAFTPDVCLINRYEPGTHLSLHQDRDEHDYRQPIISVSLGIPAVFLFGGAERSERTRRIAVENGDVAVWGGPARLFYHGVAPLKPGFDPLLGNCRINLTFRKAL